MISMSPGGNMPFHLTRVVMLFFTLYQIWHLSVLEKQNLETTPNNTISSTPCEGPVNPLSYVRVLGYAHCYKSACIISGNINSLCPVNALPVRK